MILGDRDLGKNIVVDGLPRAVHHDQLHRVRGVRDVDGLGHYVRAQRHRVVLGEGGAGVGELLDHGRLAHGAVPHHEQLGPQDVGHCCGGEDCVLWNQCALLGLATRPTSEGGPWRRS